MSELRLYLRRDSLQEGTDCAWALLDDTGQLRGSGARLEELPRAQHCRLVLAGDLVLTVKTRLPDLSERRLAPLLPAAVEAATLVEADTIHAVLMERAMDAESTLAVLEEAWLRRVLDKLAGLGLYPDCALPDYLLLPWSEGEWSIGWRGAETMARFGKVEGMSLDDSEPPVGLTLAVAQTTALDFNFDSLFRTNRFNGPDRQGDANQLTLALVSRTLDPRSGEEVLRAGIGQIYYFNDRTVGLPSEPTGGESTSPLVTEVAARISRTWQAKAGLQWDPNDDGGQVTQGLAQVSYKDRNRRVFNAAYRMRDDTVEQTDLAGLWPVSADTSVIGRWNYSLRDDRTLEALAGVEHGRCCWRVRALVRRFANAEDSNNLAFLLQLELYGLGRLGSNIDDYLERGIYGYRVSDHD